MPKTRARGNSRENRGQKGFQLPDVPEGIALKPRLLPTVSVPTDDYRHLAKVRDGSISAEVFCRDPDRRHELGLPIIYSEIEN